MRMDPKRSPKHFVVLKELQCCLEVSSAGAVADGQDALHAGPARPRKHVRPISLEAIIIQVRVRVGKRHRITSGGHPGGHLR